MELGPWLKVSSNRLENPEVEPATPGSGLQSNGLSTTPLLLFHILCLIYNQLLLHFYLLLKYLKSLLFEHV